MLQGSRQAAQGRLISCCAVAILTTAAAATAADLPDHPALLAPLTPDAGFPRFTPAELAAAGYPDHKYVFAYPGYEPFVDGEGEPYGPLSLHRPPGPIQPRDGLILADGEIRYRGVRLRHDPAKQTATVIPMVEMLDWARRDLAALLAHEAHDTLLVEDTVDLADYRRRTGYGFHRPYRDQDGRAVLQPAQMLMARGLASYTAFHLVAVRLLEDLAGGRPLPIWLREGLASYLAEEGNNHLSFVARYRAEHPVVVPPDEVRRVLGGPPLDDDQADALQVRVASHSAFLMAWELVENRGGLKTVRELLVRIGRGEDPDDVCRSLYGTDLAGLAASLDATTRPEPVGDAVQPRSARRAPSR